MQLINYVETPAYYKKVNIPYVISVLFFLAEPDENPDSTPNLF